MSDSPLWPEYRALLADAFGLQLVADPREHWIDVRGHRLRVDEWPAPAPRGTIILVHGGGGNGRILAPFAEPLASRGWRVLAADLPGFGLTVPSPGFDWDYAEWPAVVAALADQQEQPVVLFGLSMGGMTAVLAATKARSVAAVIATTLLDMSDPAIFDAAARAPWLGRFSRMAFRRFPRLLDPIRLPLHQLAPLHAMSSSVPLQQWFARQPLIGASWKPLRFFRTLHLHPHGPVRLSCPLLLAHPGADAWTPPALSLPTFARIEAEKDYVLLGDGAHLPVEPPAHAELMATVETWLRQIG